MADDREGTADAQRVRDDTGQNASLKGEDMAAPSSNEPKITATELNGESQKRQEMEPPAKRTRRTGDADASGRGRRMFGLLNQTLSKAKEDNAKRNSGEAAQRRASLEARLQDKLKKQTETLDAQKRLEGQLESEMTLAYQLALKIAAGDSANKIRKAQKRRLASFLVTPSPSSAEDGIEASQLSKRLFERPENKEVQNTSRVIVPRIPLVVGPTSPNWTREAKRPDAHALYYLPKKMLTEQDDELDNQEDKVDDEIERTDEEWERIRENLMHQLKEKKLRVKEARKDLERTQQEQKGDVSETKERQGSDGTNAGEREPSQTPEDTEMKT